MKIKMLTCASDGVTHYLTDKVYDVAPSMAKSFVNAGAAIVHEEGVQEVEPKADEDQKPVDLEVGQNNSDPVDEEGVQEAKAKASKKEKAVK